MPLKFGKIYKYILLKRLKRKKIVFIGLDQGSVPIKKMYVG